MISIAQSTAYVVVFKAYLSSDHVTEATGKTIAITISKNGGAFGNPNVGALNATEISSGWYKFTLDTTDTNALGPVAYRGAVATIDDVGSWVNVVSATTGGATNLDAAISSRMATYTQPTGFLAATFPTGTVANTTNITAGTIATVSGNVTGSVGSVVGAVGSVTGLTASNLDATISSRLASASYTAPPTAVANADALLDRDMSTGTDSGSPTVRTPRQALRFLRNKWAVAAGTLTVRKEDDTTASWTAVVTTDAAAIPIIGNDPA